MPSYMEGLLRALRLSLLASLAVLSNFFMRRQAALRELLPGPLLGVTQAYCFPCLSGNSSCLLFGPVILISELLSLRASNEALCVMLQ